MPEEDLERGPEHEAAQAPRRLFDVTRGVLGNGTPYDEFVKEFGEEGKAFLGKLGVVRIPANEVTLSPALLGSKFRRIANKTVMKKHGAK